MGFARKSGPHGGGTTTSESCLRRYELLWALALALLAVNDHLLKGSGLLPGWLTGKLSDVAGLLMAPVLVAGVAALASLPRARTASFALVVVPFVAIKSWPPAARTLESALRLLGVEWRIWSDPTDLVALLVLPLAWRSARAIEHHLRSGSRKPRHVVGAALGGLACLATSTESLEFSTSAYLVNVAHEPVTIKVFRLRSAAGCPVPTASLGGADFEAEFCQEVVPGSSLPLDRDFSCPISEDDCGTGAAEPPCDAVVLRAKGLEDSIVSWQLADNDDVPQEPGVVEDDLDERAVYVEPAGRALVIASSKELEVATFRGELPSVDCADLPSLFQLGSSSGEGGAASGP